TYFQRSAGDTPSPACGRRWREAPDEGKARDFQGGGFPSPQTLSRKRERGRAAAFIDADLLLKKRGRYPSPACGRRWREAPDEGKARDFQGGGFLSPQTLSRKRAR